MWLSHELTQTSPGSLQTLWNFMVEAHGQSLGSPSEPTLFWGWWLCSGHHESSGRSCFKPLAFREGDVCVAFMPITGEESEI